MKSTFLVPSVLLLCLSGLLPAAGARADQVLYEATGFITGAESFTASHDFTTAGTLTITLTEPPNWLDTIKDLNCFVSTTTGVLGQAINGLTDTVQIQPGMVYAHWSGQAVGDFPFGVYGITIEFAPATVAPVPLPGSLGLMLSALGALALLRRSRLTAAARV